MMRVMDDDGRRRYIGVAVLLLVALALVAMPRGDDVINVVTAALQVAFLTAIALSVRALYRSWSGRLAEFSDRDRAILYGALGAAMLVIVGRGRFDELGDFSLIAWIAALAACGFAMFWVWRESRRHSF